MFIGHPVILAPGIFFLDICHFFVSGNWVRKEIDVNKIPRMSKSWVEVKKVKKNREESTDEQERKIMVPKKLRIYRSIMVKRKKNKVEKRLTNGLTF
jgi:hypothetical protein